MSDGRTYLDRPLIGVGAVVLYQGLVLLIRRARPPRQGQWSIPGGLLELGETFEAAVRREVHEETGLELGPLVFLEVVDLLDRDDAGRVRRHYILIDVTAEALQSQVVPSDEVLDAAWFAPSEIDEMGLWSETARIIGRACAHHGL